MKFRETLILCALACAACHPAQIPDQRGSSLQAGWLGGLNSYWLTRYQDGATLKVCGANSEIMQWAINAWAAAIGKRFQFAVCDQNQGAHLWSYSQQESERNGWCAQHAGRAYALPDRTPLMIVDCGGYARVGASYLLHEVGHLFGMCDQYPESVKNCAYTTTPVQGSVMYSAATNVLTPDDVQGIRAIAQDLGQGQGLPQQPRLNGANAISHSSDSSEGPAAAAGPINDSPPVGLDVLLQPPSYVD